MGPGLVASVRHLRQRQAGPIEVWRVAVLRRDHHGRCIEIGVGYRHQNRAGEIAAGRQVGVAVRVVEESAVDLSLHDRSRPGIQILGPGTSSQPGDREHRACGASHRHPYCHRAPRFQIGHPLCHHRRVSRRRQARWPRPSDSAEVDVKDCARWIYSV